MRKKIFIFIMMISFIFPAYAETVLFMKPVTKGIEKSEANKIIKKLEAAVNSKLNAVSYKSISKAKLKKFTECGSKVECWSENAADEDFQYVLLTVIKTNEDEEVSVKFALINIEEEDSDNLPKTYDSVDDITDKVLLAQIKKLSGYDSIKGGKKSKNEDEIARRMKKEEERQEKERKKLEDERKKREREIEKQQKEEERLAKDRKKKKRIEDERLRREEEAEMARLEKERERREIEKRKEKEGKKQSLRDNESDLRKGRELILEQCAQGNYSKAIEYINKLSTKKCECDEDQNVATLKAQLLQFNKVLKQILKGIEAKNSALILDNIEAAKALDESIVEGGTEFSQKVDKYAATGWLARGREMEKANKYIEANEAFEKCIEVDPEKSECNEWLENKPKLVKKIYTMANLSKDNNPTKAKELLRAILKLVTAENEYYKKAESDLQILGY